MRPLNAAEMSAAEQAAIEAGTPVEQLMEGAGAHWPNASYPLAGTKPTPSCADPAIMVGDGYVAARHLKAQGGAVRVAALSSQKRPQPWRAPSGTESGTLSQHQAPLLIEALFGHWSQKAIEPMVKKNFLIIRCRRGAGACDLHVGRQATSARCARRLGLTLANLGAIKPAHRSPRRCIDGPRVLAARP